MSRGVAEETSVPSSETDDGAEVPTAFGTGREAGASGTPDAPAWLQPILRLLSEAQHELATKNGSLKTTYNIGIIASGVVSWRKGRRDAPLSSMEEADADYPEVT